MRAASAFWPMFSKVTVLWGWPGVDAAIAASACAMNGEGSAQRSARSQSVPVGTDIATIRLARWMLRTGSGTHPASTSVRAQTHQPSFALGVRGIRP